MPKAKTKQRKQPSPDWPVVLVHPFDKWGNGSGISCDAGCTVADCDPEYLLFGVAICRPPNDRSGDGEYWLLLWGEGERWQRVRPTTKGGA